MADDAKRIHDADQRGAEAERLADESASFYKRLRARGVPPAAAQALTERFVESAVLREDSPPEPWR